MMQMCRELGFRVDPMADGPALYSVVLNLKSESAAKICTSSRLASAGSRDFVDTRQR